MKLSELVYQKEEAERLHQEIFALWKFYKFVYELYRIPRFGGTV